MKTSQELLDDLEAWCQQRYGRKTKVAKLLGVTPQIVNDWFVKDVDKRSKPTWETGRKIEVFLAMSDHARRTAIKEKPQATDPRIQAWAKRNKARQQAIGSEQSEAPSGRQAILRLKS